MTITQDATSLKYIPQSSAEWTSLLAGTGISNPSLACNFSQASGACIDLIGSINLSVSGPFAGPTFHHSVTGWTNLGILFRLNDDDDAVSNDTGLPDLSTTSMAVFMWTDIPNVNRGLVNMGTRGTNTSVSASPDSNGTNHNFALISAANSNPSTLTDADGGVHAVLLQANRATSTSSLTTENGQATCAIGLPTGKELRVGGADFSGGAALAAGSTALYLASWFGAAAEFSLAKATQLVGLMSTGPVPSGSGRLVGSPLVDSSLIKSPLVNSAPRRLLKNRRDRYAQIEGRV